ncbi:MAG: hypothetical protein EOM76_09620, partial [Sphingobacteriia bacterium]|nr:hypothetical protein [Sphingobacteriia bacterium]
MASPILNVTELWVASTGEILDQSGTSQFHAQNNYANLILVNLEDGVGYDSTTLINFTPQTKSAYTSHWFYMSYQGLVEHEVGGEVRNFAQYAIRVPRVVLQNSNKNGFTVNDVVVKQTYGTNFIGQFATLSELNSENPPTEALDDDNSVAYVISDADKGFYQVELDGTYVWSLMDNVALALESKQYNQFQIQVQAGSANPNDVVSVSAENVTVIMGILNNLQVDIDRIEENVDLLEEFDIDLLAGEKIFHSLTVDTNDTDAPTTIGETKWDGIGLSTKLTNAVTLQLGRELFAYCRNAETTTMTKGTIVYMSKELLSGSPDVFVRRASNDNDMAYKTIGVATHDIPSKQNGFITLIGGLDLNSGHGFNAGQTIYLGLNGAMTDVEPTKPSAIVEIGIVKPADRILVIPKIHFPIRMASDVSIITPQEDDILVRNSDGVFVNSQRLKNAEDDIDDLYIITGDHETRVQTLEGEVDTLQTEMINAQGDIVDLETANMLKDVSFTALTGTLQFTLYDDTTKTIDLPTELIVSGGEYDEVNQDIILHLANGDDIVI